MKIICDTMNTRSDQELGHRVAPVSLSYEGIMFTYGDIMFTFDLLLSGVDYQSIMMGFGRYYSLQNL